MTEEMKKVYDVKDIQEILGLGRSKAYIFLEQVYKDKKPFRVIKIGKLYKIPKKEFNKWIDEDDETR